MKFQIGDWVTTQGWRKYFQVTGVTTDGNKILVKEDDAEEWYSSEGFTKKGKEMQDSNKVKPDEFQSGNIKGDSFKVGDEVWCIMRGKGKVVMVLTAREQQHCPIVVDFEKTINPDTGQVYSNRHQYTKDGRWYQDFNRTLFFSKPKVEASVTRPFVPTLVGKRVVVKETACYDVCIKIEFENQETFGGEGYSFRKALVEVYEVSSENLLKP